MNAGTVQQQSQPENCPLAAVVCPLCFPCCGGTSAHCQRWMRDPLDRGERE